jgi:hypothetical protein
MPRDTKTTPHGDRKQYRQKAVPRKVAEAGKARLPADHPYGIARGAAIGVFSGIAPTFGAAALLALAVAFLLKANKPAAVLGSFIMNPVTSTFFWTGSVILGSVILGEDSGSILATVREKSLMDGITRAWVVFLVGNTIIAAIFTIASYYLTKNAVVKHRIRKKRRKEIRRGAL